MKKLLKADEIKIFSITAGAAVAKADYEQLILAISRSAVWAAETDADVIITTCATSGGTYAPFKTINVAPGAGEIVQFQVNLVGALDYIKIAFEQNATPADLLVGDAVLADKRDVDTADVEELPVPAVIHDTLVL